MPRGIYTRTKEMRTGKHMLGRKLSEETREKISQNHSRHNLGKKNSDEARAKISAALKGKKWSDEALKNRTDGIRRKNATMTEDDWAKFRATLPRGEKHWEWKGENVGYRVLHLWVERYLGKPKECEHCGKGNLVGHNIHWANKSREYKRELSDWLRLCVSCHATYDKNQLALT